ncbi:MAG: hypothetical protein ACLUYV_08685 [Alistipes shahii]
MKRRIIALLCAGCLFSLTACQEDIEITEVPMPPVEEEPEPTPDDTDKIYECEHPLPLTETGTGTHSHRRRRYPRDPLGVAGRKRRRHARRHVAHAAPERGQSRSTTAVTYWPRLRAAA